ncbi:MerR family transcriptional regulator [Nocardioides sp.]|uniref:MerR family transcriptional regulator n=1 Tax=Nocardioides sp. TaxID=35761 RepID=UPI003515AB27
MTSDTTTEQVLDDGPDEPLLTLEELCARVGISVRNVRFYTSRGLVPPPLRRGRSGYYTPDHVARLELVQELQAHGFTLSAIERYLEDIPADATPGDIALRRTMLAPWAHDRSVRMTRADLESRAERPLSDDDLALLATLNVVEQRPDGTFDVSPTQLSVAFGLIEIGFPPEAAAVASQMYADHGRQIARELYDIFRRLAWPTYKEAGMTPESVQAIVERLKPLSITSLVAAYEAGMDEIRRENIDRRTRAPRGPGG